MGRARRTAKRKLPVIKRVRQSRPAKQVSVASSVQTRPAIKRIPLLRRRKIKPPTFGRARAGARSRRPIRVKPKGRLVSVRKRPFVSEKILRVASRGLGIASETKRERRLRIASRVVRKRVGARGRRPIREGRRFLSIQSRVIGRRPPLPRPRQVTKSIAQRQQKPFTLIPFQEDRRVFRVASKRGLQRSRGTAGRKIAVRKGIGFLGRGVTDVARDIGDVRSTIFDATIVGRPIKKVREQLGSDFNVLNLFG